MYAMTMKTARARVMANMATLAKKKVYRVEDRKRGISMFTFIPPVIRSEKITHTYTLAELLKKIDERGSMESIEMSETQAIALLEELI